MRILFALIPFLIIRPLQIFAHAMQSGFTSCKILVVIAALEYGWEEKEIISELELWWLKHPDS